MKKLGSKGMKVLKTIHLILVMMWTIGVVSMAILTFVSVQSGDELYMKFKIIRFIDDWLVIPGATLTVFVGIAYGVWTNWGFFKHRWITVKWIAGMTVIIVGTFVLSPWLDANLETADRMRDAALTDADFLYQSELVFYCGVFFSLVLLFLTGISVFKPWKTKKHS